MTLASQCQDYVVPLLETTWQQVRCEFRLWRDVTELDVDDPSSAQQSADLAGVLQKEALYCAIGRCASRMKGVIPFEEWLATDLVREVRENDPRSASNAAPRITLTKPYVQVSDSEAENCVARREVDLK